MNQSNLITYLSFRWHGHTCLKDRKAKDPRTGDSLETLLQRTMDKEQALKDLGYNVVTMWQCEWERKVRENEDIIAFVQQFQIPERLNIRDSFFGGRTNGIKLFHEVDQNSSQRIYYFDFTRLVFVMLIAITSVRQLLTLILRVTFLII